MKKIVITCIFTFAVMCLPAVALGQNDNTNSAPVSGGQTSKEQDAIDLIENPGLLPDSPLYFIKSWFEELQLTFTFDEAKKAETEYRFALRRVAESEKLVEKGKVELAQKHLSKFEDRLANMQTRIQDAEDAGKDVDALIEKLESLQEHQQNVLLRVYGQVPDSAKDAILDAMESSANGLQNAIERAQGSSQAQKFRSKLKAKLEREGSDLEIEIEQEIEDGLQIRDRIKTQLETNENVNVNSSESEDERPDADGNQNVNAGNENANVNSKVNTNEQGEPEEDSSGSGDSQDDSADDSSGQNPY